MNGEMICALVVSIAIIYPMVGYIIGRYLATHAVVRIEYLNYEIPQDGVVRHHNLIVIMMWAISIPFALVAWPTYYRRKLNKAW